MTPHSRKMFAAQKNENKNQQTMFSVYTTMDGISYIRNMLDQNQRTSGNTMNYDENQVF